MYRSAIETELRLRILRLGTALREHDRGVLVGLLLSAVPFPPASLLGLGISLVNLRLAARQRLPASEKPLIRIALIAGCCSLLVGVALFAGMVMLLSHLLGSESQILSALLAPWRRIMDLLLGTTMRLPGKDGMQQI